MADSVVNSGNSGAVASPERSYRAWVFGLLGTALLMAVLGLVLAALSPESAKISSGLAFVMAMGLALVVGASKTSSA